MECTKSPAAAGRFQHPPSKEKRVWLIGNKGMLGTELSRLLERRGIPFVGTDREVDITSQAALDAYGENWAGGEDWIINCAAYTAVDKAEDDAETCRALNTTGAGNIARTAQKIKARLIHLSTDYVFDGQGIAGSAGLRPYREDDQTKPIGVYGLTKRDGERQVLEHNPRSYIIRTAWLYGEHGNNFVHTMLRLMNEREGVAVVDDQRGSPTWAADLSQALLTLVAQPIFVARPAFPAQAPSSQPAPGVPPCPAPGIYHYTNEGTITWFEFAREIYAQGRSLGLIKKECQVRPCTSAEYPAKVTRPAYSVLDKSKIKAALGLSLPLWNESLTRYLELRAGAPGKRP
jgi:dTDP-4-dehydrorhamnose reductase